MNPDRRAEILAELGRGDEVVVAERLKGEAVALAALLDNLPGDDRQLTRERVHELLAATSAAGESFLTVAFPVVEYAEGVALETLARAPTGDARDGRRTDGRNTPRDESRASRPSVVWSGHSPRSPSIAIGRAHS